MRGISIKEFGGPEVLKINENLKVPQPNDDQLLIKVSAAGVNPVDTYIRSGSFPNSPSLPFTPGYDAAGVVEKVGKNVKNFKKGERVFTTCNFQGSGTYAEYVVANPIHVGHLGNKLSFEEGAGIGVPYYTAYKAFRILVGGKGGDTVLVHGASGAVGLASVQIAKSLGCTVIGTAGTEEGLKLVKANGADFVFNHREAGYEKKIKSCVPGGVTVILEMLANVNLAKDIDIINRKGRISLIGSRGEATFDPGMIFMKEAIVTGVILLYTEDLEWKEMHGYLEAGINQGWLKPHIGLKFPLAEASKAQDTIMNTTGALGRIVLTV